MTQIRKFLQYSRFGLCVINTEETDKLFEKSLKYQPEYFLMGMHIDVLPNEKHPDLPWTFRLPFKGKRENKSKPILHSNGIKKLTGIQFTYIDDKAQDFIGILSKESIIEFKKAANLELVLVFDNYLKGQEREFKELKLTMKY